MLRLISCCALGWIVAGGAWAGEWISNGPSGGFISDLVASPHAPATLFAAAPSDGLFRSEDGGRRWEPLAEELGEGFRAVVAHPSNPDLLYGATVSLRVARSFDGGATWEVVPGSSARELVIDPLTPSTLYSTAGSRVGRSTDGGGTWELLGEGQLRFSVSQLAIDPVRPSTLYLISGLPTGGLGVWKSTDAGDSWSVASTGVEERRGFDFLLVDPVDPDVVYLGTGSGLFRSVDAGGSWRRDPVLPPVQALAVDPTDPGAVHALALTGGSARIFRSTDRGASWRSFGEPLPSKRSDKGLFFHHFVATGNGRWLVASDCGVYRAGAGARRWRRASRGLRAGGLRSVVANPREPRTLYAGHSTCGAFKSTNGGASWTRLPDPSSSGTFSLAIDPRSPRRLYATTLRGLYRSRNGGRSWRRLPADPAFLSGQIARDLVRVDPREPDHLFAGSSRFLAFSRDRGATWSLGDLGRERRIFELRELVVHPEDSSIALLATRGRGILRSADGGATWRRSSRGIPRSSTRPQVLDVAIDPRDGKVAYAAVPGRGVYKSVDGGRRWQPSNGGIETLVGVALLVDPLDSATIYLGTLDHGVFHSRDAGRSWQPLGDLGSQRVLDLALAGSTLHAAGDDGIYSYDVSD